MTTDTFHLLNARVCRHCGLALVYGNVTKVWFHWTTGDDECDMHDPMPHVDDYLDASECPEFGF